MALLGNKTTQKGEGPEGEETLPPALLNLGLRRGEAKGSILFLQGEAADSCFLLLEGEVALVRRSASGEEVELTRIKEGEWFGEVILFASKTFPAEARVSRDCRFLEFRRSKTLASSDPAVWQFFLALLARKCLTLSSRIEELTIMDTRRRLARFLVGLCPDSSQPFRIHLPKKKREIALELDMAPETLSRSFKQLEASGLIRLEGSTILVPSPSRLKAD